MEEPEEFAVDNSEPSNTTNEENTEKSQQVSGGSFAGKSKVNLPLSKVKSIIKSDPDVALTGSDTVYVMTKMTEMFIGHIANKAYHYTKLGKRKTVQDRDVMSCVINNDELAFLEGMLESEGK